MTKYTLFLLLILLISCSPNKKDKSLPHHTVSVKTHTPKKLPIQSISYSDSLNVPGFFDQFIRNHLEDFYRADSIDFNNFCKQNNIEKNKNSNRLNYYTIHILHKLFTSKTAENLSKGDILNIPYMWHWVEPNPRHKIRFSSNNTLLADTVPPGNFRRYNSYADIDRTPYLFISDLLSEKPKYFLEGYGTFNSFGWCSEREMAFVCLMDLLGFKGKVISEGNHSWSEFLIPMTNQSGQKEMFKVVVDNTFDSITWNIINNEEMNNWQPYFGNTNLSSWYNSKAHASNDRSRLNNLIVPKITKQRIEIKTVKFLNQPNFPD